MVTAHNCTRGTTLASHCRVAASLRDRVIGLLGRASLPAGEGLWILKCNAIHMIGMRFAIDVVFLDREQRVVRAAVNVRPLRMRACWRRASSALELPVGTIAATRTVPGDVIEFVPFRSSAQAPSDS